MIVKLCYIHALPFPKVPSIRWEIIRLNLEVRLNQRWNPELSQLLDLWHWINEAKVADLTHRNLIGGEHHG